jgi:RNA polymerase sigma-70 factor, ECF subfamily
MTPNRTTLPAILAIDLDRGFPHLVALYQREIFSGIRTMVATHADAEDTMQDVFLQAYRSLASWDGKRRADLAVRPWLWTIATNTCRNRARRKSRRPTEVELLIGFQDPVEPDAHPDGTLDEWAVRLGLLNAPARTAIVLRHIVGLRIDEIADIVDRPSGTVKADIHRGLKKLRTLLKEVPA